MRRLTPYYFKGDANAFANSRILGTTRTVYETTYSHGTCIDNSIRYQYNIYGWVFTCLAMIPFVLLLGFFLAILWEKCYPVVRDFCSNLSTFDIFSRPTNNTKNSTPYNDNYKFTNPNNNEKYLTDNNVELAKV